jgi:DNA-binding transcriptional MerR regulator/methylmalonyl-CoA mutase cobalamin-binding subunit
MAPTVRAGQQRHPMRVVTRRTGLSPDLLRAWERRYDVVTPSRTEGGRRLYSDTDIERLRLLYRATLAGRSIGLVAELPTEALTALVRQDAAADATAEAQHASRGVQPRDGDAPMAAADYRADAMRAIERLDATALEATLRRATIALSSIALLDGLLVPLLEDVGAHWREGTLRPVHEHLASMMVRRALDGVVESASPPLATASVVVATPSGQLHELGALLVAASAATEGWRVTYLGPDLPAEDIAECAVRTRARAVALSVVYPTGDPTVGDELRRLRAALPKRTALLVGGAAAPSYSAALTAIGAVQLDDLTGLRVALRKLRRARRRRPS